VIITDDTAQTTNLATSIVATGTAISLSGTPPGGSFGTAYTFSFNGTGNGALTYGITAGSLPNGLSMSAAGAVTGTPTALGTFNFTVTITDVTGQTTSLATSIVTTGTAISVSGMPPGGSFGTPYSFSFSGTGNGALSYAITSGALPNGLTMSPGGVVTGTPTTLGTFNFTVSITDAAALTTSLATSIVTTGTAISVSGTPPGGSFGAAYTFAFTGTGNGALSYAIAAGSLPNGLSMSSGGVITGTPTTLGTFNFTVSITDVTAQTTSLATSIVTTGAAISVSGTPPGGAFATPYNFAFSGTGNGALTYAISAGALPNGLSMSAAGVVTGTPTRIGTFNFTVSITDVTAQTTSIARSIVTTGAAIAISGTPPSGAVNTPYAFSFTATGNGALVFTLDGGTLPPGISLSAAGLLSGMPTTAGTFAISVRVTDAAALSAVRAVPVVVGPAPTPSNPGTPEPSPSPSPPSGPNRAPALTGLTDISVEENTAVAPIPFGIDDDGSVDAVSVTIGAVDPSIISRAAIAGTGASRRLEITLAEDRDGTAWVELTASDGLLSSTSSLRITVRPAPIPDPPLNLTVVADGDAALFSWQAAPSGSVATFFLIEGGSGSGLVTFPVINTGRATSQRVPLPAGQWFFRVRSGNSAGTSAPSNEVSGVVPPFVQTPGAPSTLTVAVNAGQVQFAWLAPVDGGASAVWELEVGSAPGASDRGTFRVPAGTFGAEALFGAGQYAARVRGINASGRGPASNEVRFVVGAPPSCAPGAVDPPVLYPAAIVGDLVTLAWRPSATGLAASYRILVGSAPGLANLLIVDVGSVSSFAARAPRGRYFVSLMALTPCGPSGASNEIVVDVP
jgi:hypothetical protein